MRGVQVFVIVVFWQYVCTENILKPIFQFLLRKENICGDQFHDSLWLPALDDCQIDCDISSQVCQYRIDNQYPGQRCHRLPRDCITELKRMLELDFDTPALQLPLAPLTTPKPTIAPLIMSFQPSVDFNSIDNSLGSSQLGQNKVLGIPSLPQSSLTISNRNQNLNYFESTYGKPSIVEYQKSDSKTAQVPNFYNYYTTTTVYPEPLSPSESNYELTAVPSNFLITTSPPTLQPFENDNKVITMSLTVPGPPLDYENERNLEPDQVIPPSKQTDDYDYEFTNKVTISESNRFIEPTNEIKNKAEPPTNYPILSSQTHPWYNRASMQPIYTVPAVSLIADHSARCCQWALDGLCDSSWQRIRKLCPKSCGTVYCSNESGVSSCHRVIEVNAVDCFQQRQRLYHVHDSRTYHDKYYNQESVLSQPPTDVTSKKVIYGTKKPKLIHLESEQPDFVRAYAIENEIQNWGFFG